MKGFSAEWLALRERADAAARSQSLVLFIRDHLDGGRALDLGGGTGANVRYLSQRLSRSLHWVVVDNDAALLSRVPAECSTWLADLNAVVSDAAVYRGCDLVTASALLDLVSERWLRQVVEQARAASAAVLFALNYDGRFECEPADAGDAEVRHLVNEHQKTDKGFGPALGPEAAAWAMELLSTSDYDVRHERSDWVLTLDETELQRQLVDGWANAAREIAPARASAVNAWRERRTALIEAKQSRITVGHVDIAGLPRR